VDVSRLLSQEQRRKWSYTSTFLPPILDTSLILFESSSIIVSSGTVPVESEQYMADDRLEAALFLECFASEPNTSSSLRRSPRDPAFDTAWHLQQPHQVDRAQQA
jgi:hypothetical protein